MLRVICNTGAPLHGLGECPPAHAAARWRVALVTAGDPAKNCNEGTLSKERQRTTEDEERDRERERTAARDTPTRSTKKEEEDKGRQKERGRRDKERARDKHERNETEGGRDMCPHYCRQPGRQCHKNTPPAEGCN